MERRAPLAAVALASALALLFFAQCRRQEASPPDVAPRAASKGTWLDGTIYRFRLDGARLCPSYDRAFMHIGVHVRVASKIDDLLVTPRDFKLEAARPILQSRLVPLASPGCAPQLTPTSLRAGDSVDGVVFFEVPVEFNWAESPMRITYQPTRPIGAHSVEAVLPLKAVEAVLPRKPDVWTIF